MEENTSQDSDPKRDPPMPEYRKVDAGYSAEDLQHLSGEEREVVVAEIPMRLKPFLYRLKRMLL